VSSVGHQRFGSDAATDPDPVAGDEFITRRAYQPGGDHPRDVVDEAGLEQPPDRFPDHQDSRGADGGHDEKPGNVFGTVEAVGEAAGRPAPTDRERDPQGDGVRASVKLWSVSDSSATDPVKTTIIAWMTAVATEAGQGDFGRPDPSQARVAETGMSRTKIVVVGDQVTEPMSPTPPVTAGAIRQLRGGWVVVHHQHDGTPQPTCGEVATWSQQREPLRG
jgi:hypothetical protein